MDPVRSLGSAVAEGEEGKEEGEGKKFLYRLPDPTKRKDIEYYRDPAHRGYLSHTVPEGHGPSLFFRTPGTGGRVERKTRAGGEAGENRIW